ncbi:hypothetical protein V5E97_23415 [Singulisphaera sp. Ch08]|uniref:Uncharacterized protein n=1 Tax=Singulisphaera sp. Ch08 TaxID=3120278 RepID=A0AAU7C7C6_9BACT
MKHFDKFRVSPGRKGKVDEVASDFTGESANRGEADKEIRSLSHRLRELKNESMRSQT